MNKYSYIINVKVKWNRLYESIMKDVSRIVKKHLNEESYTLYKSNKSGFGYNKPDDIVEELRYKLHQFCKDTNFNVKILKE